MSSNKRLQLYIFGKVQGVWYRKSCKEKAIECGINGFVKNMPDGSVYCEAEGDIEDLMHFLEWCKKGPELAVVESVRVIDSSPTSKIGFEII